MHVDAAHGVVGNGVISVVPAAQLLGSNESQVGLAVQHSAEVQLAAEHGPVGAGDVGDVPAAQLAESNAEHSSCAPPFSISNLLEQS